MYTLKDRMSVPSTYYIIMQKFSVYSHYTNRKNAHVSNNHNERELDTMWVLQASDYDFASLHTTPNGKNK